MALLVYADENDLVYDHPFIEMAAAHGERLLRVNDAELIPLPEGSRFFTLPGRLPVGWDNGPVVLGDEGCRAVSVFLPPAYTRTLLPATAPEGEQVHLPMWAYTAVGWDGKGFVAAAVRTDDSTHWDPVNYDDTGLPGRVAKLTAAHPDNRLIKHLARCAMEYHCFAAKNLFRRRWECPIPVSPICNAVCIGCISLAHSECCPASQERISFVPTPGEIVEAVLPHLEKAEDAIASFGQGCEGEPILQGKVLEEAITLLRAGTDRGTINLNTNGSRPRVLARLAAAGLDSVRISINALDEGLYNAYYRPCDYNLRDILESITVAREEGMFTSINLLVFPGITDREKEVEGLIDLVETTGLDLVQMRNLNIDPDVYLGAMRKAVPLDSLGAPIGLRNLIDLLEKRFPALSIGYFNKAMR